MKRRKVPARMCVACREMRPKKELIRVVRRPDGAVAIDTGGKMPGRGAYVCVKRECIALAKKRRIFERNLEITGCDGIISELYEICGQLDSEKAEDLQITVAEPRQNDMAEPRQNDVAP